MQSVPWCWRGVCSPPQTSLNDKSTMKYDPITLALLPSYTSYYIPDPKIPDILILKHQTFPFSIRHFHSTTPDIIILQNQIFSTYNPIYYYPTTLDILILKYQLLSFNNIRFSYPTILGILSPFQIFSSYIRYYYSTSGILILKYQIF